MSGGPSHVLVLTKGQADDSIIKDWRDMLGPPVVQDAQEQEPERSYLVAMSFLIFFFFVCDFCRRLWIRHFSVPFIISEYSLYSEYQVMHGEI